MDGSGNLYVADYGNHTIRKVTLAGTVTTVAGVPKISGSSDCIAVTGSAALTMIILAPPPVITSSLTASATMGVIFSYQITADKAPVSFNATGLPDGLGFDSASGLISGTPTVTGSYTATISASNSDGTGNALLSITVFPPPPPVPTGLSATAGNAQAALGWNPAPGATGYNLWRSLLSGTNFTITGFNLASNAFTDTGVTNGVLYYYVVSALNLGGESGSSLEVSARPMSPTPSGDSAPPLLTISGTTVQLTILESATGRTYQLQRTDSLAPASWTDIGSPQSGNGDVLLLQDNADLTLVPQRFYRIRIQQ